MSRNRNSIPYIFLGHARMEGRARDLREHGDRGDSQSEMENVEERRRRPHREVGREGERLRRVQLVGRRTGGRGSGMQQQRGALHLHESDRHYIASCGRGGVISRRSSK